ncbi:protein TPX2-like [Rosa sericea]
MDDQEMVEFVKEAFEGEEIDMDYEFDAPRFYDFTRLETDWEAEEAEDWFRYAGSYPSSPFIVRLLNWHKGNSLEETTDTSVEFKDVECIKCASIESKNSMEAEGSSIEDDSNRGVKCSNKMDQDTPKAKTKSSVKSTSISRSSTLMKPTASQLAKQKQRRHEVRQAHSNRLLRRVEKKLGKVAENSPSSPLFDSVATKRQKLEAGYVRMVSQLKHQPLWLHKSPKKVGAAVTSPNGRSKVTIPREPNLETAQRAQRRRYKTIAKDGEQAKIIKEPPWTLPKKSTPQAKEFQVFYFRTSQRAKQSTVDNVTNTPISSCLSPTEATEIKGPNSASAKSDKCKVLSLKKKTLSSKEGTGVIPNIKQESRLPSPRELKFDKRFMKEPPTDLFSKLSLAPDAHHNAKPELKTAYAC